MNIERFTKIINKTVLEIEKNEKKLNALNVFPFPDADTGTNILHTYCQAQKVLHPELSDSFTNIVLDFARQMILHSKGNIGIIVSQFFQGFAAKLNQLKNINNINQLQECLIAGYKNAYSSVNEPKEGTILTVMSTFCTWKPENGNYNCLAKLYENAAKVLIKSREELDVLKNACVIDSGGYAFLMFLKQVFLELSNEELQKKNELVEKINAELNPYCLEVSDQFINWKKKSAIPYSKNFESETGFYCVELLFDPGPVDNFDKSQLEQFLQDCGESLVMANIDSKKMKIHIHSREPQKILTNLEKNGKLTNVKIEDMLKQHSDSMQIKTELIAEYGSTDNISAADENTLNNNCTAFNVMVILQEEDFSDYISSLGIANILIKPSIIQILENLSRMQAKNVVLFSNHDDSERIHHDSEKNNIMKKAISLSYKKVFVFNYKLFPQLVNALLCLNFCENLDVNLDYIQTSINHTKAAIIKAKENTNNHKYTFVSLFNKKKLATGYEKIGIIHKTLLNIGINGVSLITVYAGESNSETELSEIEKYLKEKYPNLEVQIVKSKQRKTCFILSVE